MSEQAPSADSPESTPDDVSADVVSDSPENGTATEPAIDWEKRAKDNQAWATRVAQENSQYAERFAAFEDPEQYRRYGEEHHGYVFQDPDADDSLADDPAQSELAQLREQVAELSQWRQSTTAEQQQAQERAAYFETVTPQLKEMGVPDSIHELVGEVAASMPYQQTPQGQVPDLQGAIQRVEELLLAASDMPALQKKLTQHYLESKKAPMIKAGGQAAIKAVPLDATHTERVRVMLENMDNQ